MQRVLSGVQPSGDFHLGNYIGAFRQWVAHQQDDAYYCVVDLHALTEEIDPAYLRQKTFEAARSLLAVGLDPDVSTIFVQSHVPEHPRLAWILQCLATMGELGRMTQFKAKGRGQDAVRVGLFAYPVLMAADILLYQADRVPVGDDQRQHLELARELAQRFNNRYGETFVVPEAAIPLVGARVMDLQHPDRKMSKSVDSPLGTIAMLEEPAEIERKVRRAVTDTDGEMRYAPDEKPGLANLLSLLAVAMERTPEEVASGYTRYGDLKRDLADALVEMLRPVRERAAELTADPGRVEDALRAGAARAHDIASVTYARAAEAVGLLA
ncbi:MAG: tryptophan--tRNA ligase [Acidimicrobiales bacterium]